MFGKHFMSMYTGSMVGSGACVFAVWGYVIAHTVDSRVELNPRLIAAVIGESEDAIRAALEKLTSPDPESRSKVNDGRRLVREGQFQYFVPTWENYRAIRQEEERREYNREMKRKERAKTKSMTVNDSQPSQEMSAMSAKAEAEAEAEAETRKKEKTSTAASGGTVFPKTASETIREYWGERWKKVHGTDFRWGSGGMAGTALASVMETLGLKRETAKKGEPTLTAVERLDRNTHNAMIVPKVKKIIDAFMSDGDKFYEGHPPTKLRQDIHKFIARASGSNGHAGDDSDDYYTQEQLDWIERANGPEGDAMCKFPDQPKDSNA